MDIDVTYLIQLGLFLFLLVSLNGIIIQPYLKILQAREAQTEGANEQVETLTAEGDTDRDAYQAQVRKAQSEALETLDGLKDEGRKEERRILSAARAEVADKLSSTREQVAKAEGAARDALAKEAEVLSLEVTGKILGRGVA